MSGTITVPAATRSVITATPKTTFKVGSYNPLTDVFTSTLDLNDHVNYWLVSADLAQPQKVYARTSTIRAPGERISAWNYQNRHITLTLQLLYETNSTGLLAALRALLAAIENPPYRLAFAAPNATVLTYADVVAVTSTIPYDGKQLLAGITTKISIDFECAPGFSGDRITLSNLVVNPGFEAPSGPPTNGFGDNFSNANAYTLVAGAAASVTGNVMTLPAGSTVQFGSPIWGAVNIWQVRFQFATGLTAAFDVHYINASNRLQFQAFNTGQNLIHWIGGTPHTLGSSSVSLTNGTWYWMQFTQFPWAPGTQADVQVALLSDSGGTPGSLLATLGPVATFDGVTALTGKPAIEAVGAALAVGGAFNSVNQLTLFGPGGWTSNGMSGTATSITSAAWEQNTANTYPGGATTSYGAARLDLPPAGTVDAYWSNYTGSPIGASTAMPISAAGDTLAASVYVKSSGLAGTTQLKLTLQELNSSGTLLRSTTVQTRTGNQASWTLLSGTVVTGASAAFGILIVEVIDTNAGASAGGTVWFDNAQVWDQTTTGQTVMPYCELRFPQSPAQLLLTGVQGDMAAPASFNLGCYVTGWSGNGAISLALGQRAQPHAAGKLVYGPNNEPGLPQIMVLDNTVWGGCYQLSQSSNGNTTCAPISVSENALVGLFHLLLQVKANDTHYNLQTIQAAVNEILEADFNGINYAQYTGAKVALGASSSAWLRADTGSLPVPFAPSLAREDLSIKWLMLQINVIVSTFPSSPTAFGHGPTTLMPVDGGYVSVTLGNLSTYENGQWLYVYNDPPQASLPPTSPDLTGGAWRFSLESTPLANSAHAVGGPGVNGLITIQPQADPALFLDPTNTAGANGGGPISQIALTANDSAPGLTYATATEVQYVPLYLFPRQS